MPSRRAPRSSTRQRSGSLVWLGQVAAWFVIAAMAVLLVLCVAVPRLAGATPYTILTGSMSPGMPAGTLVVVKPVAIGDIGIGSVVTYQLESGRAAVATHRVVAVGSNLRGEPFVTTKGDANRVADAAPVLPQQIKGQRWYQIPYAGWVVTALTREQRQLATALVVTGLLGYAATMFTGAVRDGRRAESSRRHPQGAPR